MKNIYISVEGYAIKGVHDYSYFTPKGSHDPNLYIV